MLRINIKDKIATVEGNPVIVCGNSDYVIRFVFDDEWADKTAKTARFVYLVNGQRQYQDVVFTGDTVNVPVLANTDEVAVGAFAGDLATTTPAFIPCKRSIRCGTGAPADPPPSQYDQIMATVATKDEWITIADTTLTEDVAIFERSTDINGNPFKCKKIVLQVKCPNQLTNEGAQTISFPVASGNDMVNFSLVKGNYGFVITSTILLPNAIVKHEINRFSYVGTDTLYERTRVNSNIGCFTQYGVYLPQYPIPKDSLITVWGLKA